MILIIDYNLRFFPTGFVMKKHMRPALIPALLAAAFPVYADTANTGESNESYASTLPTVKVVG